MRIGFQLGALRQCKWYEHLVRFVFGGLITVMAGIVAKQCGPVVGGLFLAFPAIFPASATLVEKHERTRKEKKGLHGRQRGRLAAGVDAAGAALGSFGLVAFGGVVWGLATRIPAWEMLITTTVAWGGIAVLAWIIRKKF